MTDSEMLAQLVDSDAITEAKFNWDQDYQREIQSILLHDRPFLIESVGLIEPQYFDNEVHQLIARTLFKFWNDYKTLPNKNQLKQEILDKLNGRPLEVKAQYISEFEAVLDFYVPNLEGREHYRDRIVNFAKRMAMKRGIQKVLDILKTSGSDEEAMWLEIGEIWKTSTSVDRDFDMGLDYFQTYQERYLRKEEKKAKKEVFTSGFVGIDQALKNDGLIRGEIGAMMGTSGSGKSLALINAAFHNLNRGKKVLYISLEIDQDAVADRFDAQLANYGGDRGVTTKNLLDKKEIVFEQLGNYVKDYEQKTLLVVKQFASGTLDMMAFRAYFQQITMQGFRPDLVILDYVGEMKDYPGMPTHESRYRIVRDFRGFAVEEQICGLTALQPNKSGKEVISAGLLMDDEHLGDSYAQVKPLDALWSINQRMEEKECCLGRIKICKHREGESKIVFPIKFNYNTLSISQITQASYENIYKNHQNQRKTDLDSKLSYDSAKIHKVIADGQKQVKKMKFNANSEYSQEEVAPE